MTDHDIQTSGEATPINHRMYAGLFGIAAIFLLSILLGFVAGSLDGGGISALAGGIIAALVAAVAITSWSAWSNWRKADHEPEADSARKSRNIYIVSIGVGVVLGIYLMLTGGPDMNVWFSNGPITEVAAIGAIIIWAIITPFITLYWWRTTDEHELAAYSAGASTAFHIYIFAVPTWWMATRAGWLPPQDPMIIWAAAMIIWSIVWVYKKYA